MCIYNICLYIHIHLCHILLLYIGMENESIVASGIHYWHSENITESKLAFRASVCEPEYEQNDNRGVGLVYGLGNGEPLIQEIGITMICCMIHLLYAVYIAYIHGIYYLHIIILFTSLLIHTRTYTRIII